MNNLSQHQEPQSRFTGLSDREERIFQIRDLDSGRQGQNLSYGVTIDEDEAENIITRHRNSKFLSHAYEIDHETKTGECERCPEHQRITVAKVLVHCNWCGRRICPSHRKIFFGKYYCQHVCVVIAVLGLLTKSIIQFSVRIISILGIALIKLVLLPFREINRG